MQELLVLGLIPGTNIQITFGVWVVAMCIFTSTVIYYAFRKRHIITSVIVTAYLMRQIRLVRA